MFRSVLVPLDGSPFSEQVLPLAQMVGRVDGTRLHLGHVHEGAGREKKDSYLADIVGRLKDAGVEADHTLLEGKVVTAIEDWAKEVGPDLIVMATHARSGLERLRLGSVAEALVSRGLAPMLLLHPSKGASHAPEDLDHVVVPMDASSFAQSILDPLASFGAAAGVTKYTLVHVAENKAAGRAGWTPLASVQARAAEQLDPIRERLKGPNVEVDVQVVMASDPSGGILGVADQVGADVIAMTTHGMTGVRPTLLGSTASKVLQEWHGPLLLHRPG